MHAALKNEDRFQGCAFHYEYWTCGTFSPEAIVFLDAAGSKTKKYKAGWRDGPGVRAYAADVRPGTVVKVLDEHFFKHPLGRADRKYDGSAAIREVTLDMELDELGEDADWIEVSTSPTL